MVAKAVAEAVAPVSHCDSGVQGQLRNEAGGFLGMEMGPWFDLHFLLKCFYAPQLGHCD